MSHTEGSFIGLNDFQMYCQSWLPDGDPRAVLLIAHGYAEHSGRYGNFVDYFVPRGYAVHALDHRGHGKSDGVRVEVDSFDDYAVDLKTYFDLVRKQQPSQKMFLVGHSMGAAIAIGYAALHQDELDGVVFSGGGVSKPGDPAPPPLAPGQTLADAISRDDAVVQAYKDDPLVYLGPPPTGRTSALSGMRERSLERAAMIHAPVLIMAGEASPLGEGPRSKNLYETVASKDKTLKLYPELFHEIFNEPERAQVFADMEEWLEARL